MSATKTSPGDGKQVAYKTVDPEQPPQILYTVIETSPMIITTYPRRRFLGPAISLTLLILTGAWLLNSQSKRDRFESSCMLSFGGGNVGPGGNFINFSPSCEQQLKRYFGHPCQPGPYYAEVVNVSESAVNLFTRLSQSRPATRDQVIVFDIDETTLSNRETFFKPRKPSSSAHVLSKNLGGNVFDAFQVGPFSNGEMKEKTEATTPRASHFSSSFSGMIDSETSMIDSEYSMMSVHVSHPMKACSADAGFSPALEPMLHLYQTVYGLNYSVAFVTGRSDRDRNHTLANLEAAGYGRPCAAGVPEPCFVTLFTRRDDDLRLASVYKPEKRGELEAVGFEVIGNFGDQYSDLTGPYAAPNSFKLPNPVYYIL